MDISVIIPIYNSEKELKRMLDCVVAQTFRDIEIICVDDGSTDSSGKICDDYARKDSRFKVVHQKNKGVSAARNTGLSLASGKYVSFLDSDDIIELHMLEKLFDAARDNAADLVTCDLVCNNDHIKCNLEERIYHKKELFNEVLPRFTQGNSIAVFCPVNKLYRRSMLLEHQISWNENISFQEDLMFTVTVFACASSMVYVKGAYYHYLQESGGLCSSYRENAGNKFIYARNEFDRLIKKYQMVNLDYPSFNSAFLYNITFYIYRSLYNIKDNKYRNKLIADVLNDELTKRICDNLLDSASSFDRRIAYAIAKRHFKVAILLIKFVHSGRAAKLQHFISRLRGNKPTSHSYRNL